MTDKIDHFDGDYRWLSNFYIVDVEYEDHIYKSVEHAYQSAKTTDKEQRIKIKNASSPAQAKKLGQEVSIRDNWDSIKLDVMYSLLQKKFANAELKQLLLDTKDAELIEGNWWGDVFWGICKGRGHNHLGKLLMRVREELNGQK